MLELFTFSFPSDEHRFWEDLRLVCPALSGNAQGKQRRTGTSDPQHFSSLILEKIRGSAEKYIASPRHSGLVVNYISSMPKQFLLFFRFQTSHFLGAFPCGPNFDSFGSQSQPHESVGSGGLSNNYCAASIHCRIVARL